MAPRTGWSCAALTVLATLALSVASAVTSTAAVASPGVPDPSKSYVPPRLVSCPAGDSTYVVMVRDRINRAFSGRVYLYVCGCPGYRLSLAGTHPYTVDPTGCDVSVYGDPYSGYALFPLAAGGLCPGDSIRVNATGIVIGFTRAVSIDQNGDLAVDANDVAIAQAKIGTSDPSADFDGDGQVTAADVAVVEEHLGHQAPEAHSTPVRSMTWGRLKLLYK
jgi:hypothetical protein